jgi:hypothetical protein
VTGQEVVLDLLRYVGVTGFTAPANDQALNRPGLDDDDIRRALAAVNSALQTIRRWGPQDLKYGEKAAFFNDPLELTITVTALGGQSAVATTTPPAWTLGCSALIEGDNELNQIDDITGNNFSFKRGYRGTNLAGLKVTIYADCVLLSEEIGAVQEPVAASPNLRLYPARDLDEFRRIQRRFWFMGYQRPYSGFGYAIYETPNPRPGIPGLYYVERRPSGELFLRLAPMPSQKLNATFQAKLRAERIDATVLDETGATDPGYEFTSLHQDEVESVLLPLARWRFFTHPALKNAESRGTVKAEFDEVMLTLKHGATLEASTHDNRALYI